MSAKTEGMTLAQHTKNAKKRAKTGPIQRKPVEPVETIPLEKLVQTVTRSVAPGEPSRTYAFFMFKDGDEATRAATIGEIVERQFEVISWVSLKTLLAEYPLMRILEKCNRRGDWGDCSSAFIPDVELWNQVCEQQHLPDWLNTVTNFRAFMVTLENQWKAKHPVCNLQLEADLIPLMGKSYAIPTPYYELAELNKPTPKPVSPNGSSEEPAAKSGKVAVKTEKVKEEPEASKAEPAKPKVEPAKPKAEPAKPKAEPVKQEIVKVEIKTKSEPVKAKPVEKEEPVQKKEESKKKKVKIVEPDPSSEEESSEAAPEPPKKKKKKRSQPTEKPTESPPKRVKTEVDEVKEVVKKVEQHSASIQPNIQLPKEGYESTFTSTYMYFFATGDIRRKAAKHEAESFVLKPAEIIKYLKEASPESDSKNSDDENSTKSDRFRCLVIFLCLLEAICLGDLKLAFMHIAIPGKNEFAERISTFTTKEFDTSLAAVMKKLKALKKSTQLRVQEETALFDKIVSVSAAHGLITCLENINKHAQLKYLWLMYTTAAAIGFPTESQISKYIKKEGLLPKLKFLYQKLSPQAK